MPLFQRPGTYILGVLAGNPIVINESNYDLNNAPHGYIFIGHLARATCVNNPFGNEVVGVLTIRYAIGGIGDIRLQTAFRDNGVKIRVYWVSTWGEWKDVI